MPRYALMCYAIYAPIQEATDLITFEISRAPEGYNSLNWEWHSEIYIGQGIPKYGGGVIPFVTSS